MKRIAIILAFAALPCFVRAEDGCDCKCNHCGCQSHCQKVCHIVCEMKEVKVTCYCCKEEDVCIPGCSKKCGEVCEPNPCCLVHPENCEACQEHHHGFLSCLCGYHEFQHRTLWEPSCSGHIREVNKLMKYEANKKLPTYKWVVEYCCDKCAADIARDQQNILAQQSKESLLPVDSNIQLTGIALPLPPATAPAAH